MRVLDLGTGPGHVAFLVAELVGPEGSVLGIDQSTELLMRAAGIGPGMRVLDLGSVRARGRADVPRHGAVRRHRHPAAAVPPSRRRRRAPPPPPEPAPRRPDGRHRLRHRHLARRAAVELAATVLRWVEAGFRAAGADPRVGARLGPMLRAAGYEDVAGFGVQGYLQPDERPERLLARRRRARWRRRSWRAASPRRRISGSTRSTPGSRRPWSRRRRASAVRRRRLGRTVLRMRALGIDAGLAP